MGVVLFGGKNNQSGTKWLSREICELQEESIRQQPTGSTTLSRGGFKLSKRTAPFSRRKITA
jgi:hypothetical protein